MIDIEKLAEEHLTPFARTGWTAYGEQLKRFADALLEDKEREIAELKDWKKQAIDFENEWDEQAVGKALNVQLGQSIRRSILPKIIELQSHINDLREALHLVNEHSKLWGFKIAGNVQTEIDAALSATPAQSLQAFENEVIERCAEEVEERGSRFEAEVIRALKGGKWQS